MTTPKTATDWAAYRNRLFVDGYLSGERGECQSDREVAAKFPTLTLSWEREVYLCGQDDGRKGDLWRIRNMDAEAVLAERRAPRIPRPEQVW